MEVDSTAVTTVLSRVCELVNSGTVPQIRTD